MTSNGPTASDYETKTQEEHLLSNMEMYIGNRYPREVVELIFDGQKIYQRTFIKSDALERIFLEILSNASDNVAKTRRSGYNAGQIRVFMNEQTIIICNEGLPIPVEMHPKYGVWVPDMIFGKMLSSSNYSGTRHGAGVNGLGAKATNILSVYFSVEIFDAVRHLHYKQEWSQNKTIRGEPVITQYPGDQSSVTITFTADFPRFGFQCYTPDFLDLYRFHVFNVAMNEKIPVSFNGTQYVINNLREYGSYIFGDKVDTAIIHYEWPEGTEIVKSSGGVQQSRDGFTLATIEMLVLDTPDEGESYSFVNCMTTPEGGIHVNKAIEAVSGPLLGKINDETTARLAKSKIEPSKKYILTIADVKPHISLILFARLPDPVFSNQSKVKLIKGDFKISLEDKELDSVKHWQLTQRLYQVRDGKQQALLIKSEKRQRGRILDGIGREANDAGGKNSANCVLFLTEGASGSGLINSMINYLGTTDTWGVLPLRGKPKNVRDCDIFDLEENDTFNNLKAYLGLKEFTDYTIEENFQQLRYHLIVLAADADDDGKHIIGLLINYFEQRFPTLLARGIIRYLRTPLFIIRSKNLRFYTREDYLRWHAQNPNVKTSDIRYVKGLGSVDEKKDLPGLIQNDSNSMYVNLVYDQFARDWLNLAFDKKKADSRKEWILKHAADIRDSLETVEPISKFIDDSMFLYTRSSLVRALPDVIDGFKPSQRKVIYTLFSKFGKKKCDKTDIKVAQAAAATAEMAKYHHGEKNLEGVIVNMAQDFIGSNNIPLLQKDGQFGTRFEGGDDKADGRYIFVAPDPLIFNKIFRKEDLPILTHNIEEGDPIEPTRYYPIIPTVLMNGASGIATGFSTMIPPHHPIHIIDWLISRLNGALPQDIPGLLPFYRGYTGEIRIVPTTKEILEDADPETDPFHDPSAEDFFDGDRSKYSMITTGRYMVQENQKTTNVTIVELPIGVKPRSYVLWLERRNEKEKFCKEIRSKSVGDTIDITLKGYNKIATVKDLRLQRSFGISNMVLLDETGAPLIFENATHILEYFYRKRLPIYQIRKDYDLSQINKRITLLEYRKKLCDLVLAHKEMFLNTKKAQIQVFLEQHQVPFEIYSETKLYQISYDKIIELEQEISEEKQHYKILYETDIRKIWFDELKDLRDTIERHYKL